MSKSTTGAQPIEKQYFSCVIRKIECNYSADNQSKRAVLYERDLQKAETLREEKQQREIPSSNGVYQCWITNDLEYYFITNNKGKDITLTCNREVNCCTIEEHSQYVIDSVDINTKELKTIAKGISDGKLTLYYFDLFYRTAEYRNIGFSKGAEIGKSVGGVVGGTFGKTAGGIADAFISGDPDEHRGSQVGEKVGTPIGAGVGMVTGAGIGGVGGAVVGDIADIIASLRFIHLPRIARNDNNYNCYTSLQYSECPHLPSIPSITIYSYPDIEFSLKIGFMGRENKYYAYSVNSDSEDKRKYEDKRKISDFCLDFSVTYASVTKKLEFEQFEEKTLDAEEQKGTVFYKSINAIAVFFKESADFAEKLKEKVEPIYGKDDSLTKDIGAVSNGLDKLSTLPQWISGSINIAPSLQGKWRYSVSNDLTRLGKNIKVELGVDCKGELKLDLIKLGKILLKKTKDVTTIATAATTVASGGLAGVPAVLIRMLVDSIVEWLINKEGVYFYLIFIGNANFKSCMLSWDTCRDTVFEGEGVTLETMIEIKLEIGLQYKTSFSLIATVKAEFKASAEAAVSLKWKMEPCIKHGYLGVDINVAVPPIYGKIECRVEAGWEIEKLSTKTNNIKKSNIKEWKTKEIKMEPTRWDWLQLDDGPDL